MATYSQRILKEFKSEFDDKYEVISLIYNPKEEVEPGDNNKISYILKDLNISKAILIINGGGGLTEEGKKIAITFRSKFKKAFFSLVPERTCSALVYSILISSCLLVSKESTLGPIDPYFYYHGRYFPALSSTKDKNPEIKRRAIEHSNQTLKFCAGIFKSPGSIIKGVDQLKCDNLIRIASFLFNADHDKKIYPRELEDIGFRTYIYDSCDPIWKRILEYYSLKKAELVGHNKRFVLETTSKYFIY